MHVDGLDQALGCAGGVFEAVAARHLDRTGLPWVTLCWAQTLDGSTALRRGTPAPLSGPESTRLTHALRAAHRAILVGIGTVLADDPLLTVRHVEGPDPRPVVLDGTLRLPPTARLLREKRDPWIWTAGPVDAPRRATLEGLGAVVHVARRDAEGHVDLTAVLRELAQAGVSSLMVEGGASVITAFLKSGLADRAAITIAPLFAGGYAAVGELGRTEVAHLPRLHDAVWFTLGVDGLVTGRLRP